MKSPFPTLQRQPFPLEKPVIPVMLSALAVGLFVYLFLMIFQPFGTDEYIRAGNTWIIRGYGFVTVLVLLFDSLLLPKIFPGIFDEAKWNTLQEICFQFWNIISIGTANILYANVVVDMKISFPAVLNFFLETLSIGFFPITIGVLSTHYFLLKKYGASIKRLNETIASGDTLRKEMSKKPVTATITSENGKENIEVELNNLLFIKSIDNYIEIWQISRGAVETALLRSTLKRIEERLTSYPFLFRCHRTYLVNVNRISKITGNCQGYRLVFDHLGQSIPVARGCSKKFTAFFSRRTA